MKNEIVWIKQVNAIIDALEQEANSGEVKVSKQIYDFWILKFKTNTVRGFKLIC